MHTFYYFLLSCVGVLIISGCANPELLTMQPAVSSEGWRGNAFYRNGIIASEEFASGANGSAVDVWRFYDSYGRLYREELDTRGGGSRNLQRDYNKDGILIVERIDNDGDGAYDQIVERAKTREREPAAIAAAPTDREPRRSRHRENSARISESYPASQPLEIAPEPVAESYPSADESTSPTIAESSASAPQTPASVAPPRNHDNWIRPIKLPTPTFGDSTNATTRVVPGPVFQHPSDDLED